MVLLFLRTDTHAANEKPKMIYRYFHNIGIGLSITINAILFGNRYETLSARQHRSGNDKGCAVIDSVFGEDHCFESHIIYTYTQQALKELKEENEYQRNVY